MYIIKTKRCLEYRLNKEIRRGRLLEVSGVQRRLGKTTLLYNIAKIMSRDSNKVLIVEPDMGLASMLNREFNTDIFISKSRIAEISRDSLFFILVDEGLSLYNIMDLKNYFKSHFIGGYFRKPLYDDKPLIVQPYMESPYRWDRGVDFFE